MRVEERIPRASSIRAMETLSRLVETFASVRLTLSIGLIVAAFLAFQGPAFAHGRLGAAEGRCRLFIGPDIMNFTGYNPDSSKNEFCEDIPAAGHMIMVLDDVQPELRDMKVELRIVRDVGGEERENENLGAVTVAYREPKLYPTGTINFEHYFAEPGYFVGIVTVTGSHGERWVSRFPFSVGLSFERTLPVYTVLVLGVLGAFWAYLRHRPVAKSPSLPPLAPQGPAPTPAE
ncbi:MAG TPA: hypothetical protein VK446_02855 [Methylocystis sp.]|nr:hypothetical protein [Methylocystis sp.]